jgi:hypothetical protein
VVPGVDQTVLSAVIFDKAVPMISAVVFENKSRLRVIEIRACDELRCIVAKACLHLRLRQTSLDQQPSEASLHGRFGWRGQLGERGEARHPGLTQRRFSALNQRCVVGAADAHRHVDRDQGVDRRPSQTEARKSQVQSLYTKSANRYQIETRNIAVVNEQSRTGAHANESGHDHLNRIRRGQLQAIQPGGGCPGEHSICRKSATPGRERCPGIGL